MKRELTRARSKLEEEKSIRGNIQVLYFDHSHARWSKESYHGASGQVPLRFTIQLPF